MSTNELVPSLGLFTLIAVVVVAVVVLAIFLRKRSNRHPMDTPAGKAAEERERQDALRNRR